MFNNRKKRESGKFTLGYGLIDLEVRLRGRRPKAGAESGRSCAALP